MMHIVIDIPDEKYDRLVYQDIISLRSYVENGTVLSKGHGRLIDADALLKDVRHNSESYFADDFAHEWVDVAPTIIEKDGN